MWKGDESRRVAELDQDAGGREGEGSLRFPFLQKPFYRRTKGKKKEEDAWSCGLEEDRLVGRVACERGGRRRGSADRKHSP